MGDEGIELPAYSRGIIGVGGEGGNKSGALPADLARVIEAWPTLTRHQRRRIVALVEAARGGAVRRR